LHCSRFTVTQPEVADQTLILAMEALNYGTTMPKGQRNGRHRLSARIMELLSGKNDVALTGLSLKITGG